MYPCDKTKDPQRKYLMRDLYLENKYKALFQLKKKTRHPNKEGAKDVDGHFSKEDTQMAKKT